MAGSNGRRLRRNARCSCDQTLFEILELPRTPRDTDLAIRVRCEKCEYLVWKFGLGKQYNGEGVRKQEVCVLHVVDLDSGVLVVAETQILIRPSWNKRDGFRGGEPVDRGVYDLALERAGH